MSMRMDFAGDVKAFKRTTTIQPLLILAALIAVYIVLGVLYESLAHPLTIISTLPSAGLGALLALEISGTELSVIAFIGIILLIGIVKKNGIMMVDFALDGERRLGLSPQRAIHEACLARFRPILMTTLAAMLGALPLVIAIGPGSELRRPLGITIIGGLLGVAGPHVLYDARYLPAAGPAAPQAWWSELYFHASPHPVNRVILTADPAKSAICFAYACSRPIKTDPRWRLTRIQRSAKAMPLLQVQKVKSIGSKADINTHSQKQLVSAKNVSPSRSDQFSLDLRNALPRVRFCLIKRTASLF